MQTMPKRKPKKPRPAPTRSGEPVNVWVSVELMNTLREYLAATRPKVTKTAAVEEALEAFLASKGFSVPKQESE